MAVRWALVLWALAASGCGYTVRSALSRLPGEARAVEVPVLENRTSEPNAEVFVTQALRDVYQRAGLLGPGDCRLEGALVELSSGPLIASPGRLPNYRLSGRAELRLLRGQVVLKAVSASAAEEFPSGADVLWSETYRALALRRLAEALAREAATLLEEQEAGPTSSGRAGAR